MSSLQHLLEQRRGATPALTPPCHTTDAQSLTLTVQSSPHETWVFPWPQLAFARLTRADAEQLCLTFASHEVIVQGRNLTGLLEPLVRLHLASVRAGPVALAASALDHPYIDGLTVRPIPRTPPPVA
jgi:hypothetical protein